MCQVAGWARVITVDNVENRGSDSGRIDTVAVDIEKKKSSERSACNRALWW